MKLDEKSGSLHADSLGDHGTRNKVANYSSALEIPYQDTAVDTLYKNGKNLESRQRQIHPSQPIVESSEYDTLKPNSRSSKKKKILNQVGIGDHL